jgi:hypothetical protein
MTSAAARINTIGRLGDGIGPNRGQLTRNGFITFRGDQFRKFTYTLARRSQ